VTFGPPTITVTASVPEPSSLALLGIGVGIMLLWNKGVRNQIEAANQRFGSKAGRGR